MDTDSCNYLLHPRSDNLVCYPRAYPVPRLLQVWAFGASDATGAPHSAIGIRAVPADTTSDSFHHALPPPLQPRGEEEKEVVPAGSCKRTTPTGFGWGPVLTWCPGTHTCPVGAAAAAATRTSGSCKKNLNWFEFTALLPSAVGLADACTRNSTRFLGHTRVEGTSLLSPGQFVRYIRNRNRNF